MANTPGERQRVSGEANTALEDFVLDPWTALSFKRALGDRRMAGVTWTSPSWAGKTHQRRLLAYQLLHAYYDNAARHFLATTDASKRSAHREYGDAALIVESVRAAVMGEDWRLHVDGADDFDPDAAATPEQAPSPDQPRPENDDQTATDTDAETQAENRRAALLLDALEGWADDEQFGHKMLDCERAAGKLGDGVYVLGWDAETERPSLETYDPGQYFPVWSTRKRNGFPTRHHIAWEIEEDEDAPENDNNNTKMRVHRITWELIDTAREGAGVPTVTHDLPWNDEPTTVTCFMSEGTWTIDKAKLVSVDHFEEASVVWDTFIDVDGTEKERRRFDIGIDYVPLVHVPNTVAVEAMFGRATITSVAQIIDDLSRTDSDAQQASNLAGFPPIAVSKASLGGDSKGAVTTYGPGTAFEVGDGNMTVLDMSNGLRALMERCDHLLSRLEVNARVPSKLLGRARATETGAESGIAKLIEFGPLRSMVSEMRLVREDKYRLLLRFVTRFLWVNNKIEQPPTAEAELVFGSFMPVDASSIVEQVIKLREADLISEATGLAMLVEAGMPIEDVAQEVIAAHETNFEAANTLLDATGDIALVAKFLGVTIAPPPPPAPTVTAPPTPGGNGNVPPAPGPVPRPAPANG